MIELIWDGKYDAHGKRVAPSRVLLPFQTIETINESALPARRIHRNRVHSFLQAQS